MKVVANRLFVVLVVPVNATHAVRGDAEKRLGVDRPAQEGACRVDAAGLEHIFPSIAQPAVSAVSGPRGASPQIRKAHFRTAVGWRTKEMRVPGAGILTGHGTRVACRATRSEAIHSDRQRRSACNLEL